MGGREMSVLPLIGNMDRLIRNDDDLYLGNLRDYYKIMFDAKNKFAPYHNLRHMLHVTMLCGSACLFYKGVNGLSPRQARNLLIAAMFHDFDHTGRSGDDDLNIELALRALRKHILPEDKEGQVSIEDAISGTQFPYNVFAEDMTLIAQILRDADVSQAFSTSWIQQMAGLAEEMGISFVKFLPMQIAFLENLKHDTEWGEFLFKATIPKKIEETRAHLELLT